MVCGGVADAFGATAVVTLLLTVVVHSGVADAVGVSGVHVCGGVADAFVVTAVVRAAVARGGVANAVANVIVTCCYRYCFWDC